jgi:hypothetical protein
MSPVPWVIIASTKYVQDLLNLFLSFKNSEILKLDLPYPFSEMVKTFWQKKAADLSVAGMVSKTLVMFRVYICGHSTHF